jgi:hypothetical protein
MGDFIPSLHFPARVCFFFAPSHVRELTTKAGFVKTCPLFAQMLQLGITNASDQLSFIVISPVDAGIKPLPEDFGHVTSSTMSGHDSSRNNLSQVICLDQAVRRIKKEIDPDEAFWVGDVNGERESLSFWEQ